jgi:hypothetical protein
LRALKGNNPVDIVDNEFLIATLTHNSTVPIRDLLEDFPDWIDNVYLKTKVKRGRGRLYIYHEDYEFYSEEEQVNVEVLEEVVVRDTWFSTPE